MHRYKQLEEAVKQYLSLKKVYFIRIDNYRCPKCGALINRNAAGFPDFMAIIGDKIYFIECKTGSGQLNAYQKKFKLNIDNLPNVEYILLRDNIDELMSVC
jgi:hypothetical protein